MRKFVLGGLLLISSSVALAGSMEATRKQIEASLLVTGSIQLDAAGAITGHSLDHPKKLDAGVIGMIEQTLPTWRFQPVLQDGQPRAVKANMSLLVVANKVDPEHFSVRIRSAHFDEAGRPKSDSVSRSHMPPPRYPVEAVRGGATGTVYLVVRIDRTGHVTDVAAEQVNLRFIDTPRQMANWRDVLAKPAIEAARRWTFHPPTTGKHADDTHWSMRVPVAYSLNESNEPYGKWQPYVPGPKQAISWLDENDDDRSAGAEAMASGQIAQVGEGLKLLTPLGDG